MNLGFINDNGNTRYMTNIFLGYNHNPVIADGELFDAKNMTCDHYPLMAPRKVRKSVRQTAREWESIPIALKDVVIIEQGGRTYYDYYYSCGASFDENLKCEITFAPNYVYNYVEVYAEKRTVTPSGVVREDKTLLLRINRDEEPVLEFNNTQVLDPDDIVVHAYGYSELDDNVQSISLKKSSGKIRGFLMKNDKVAYFAKQTLYYGEDGYDMSPYLRDEDDGVSEVKLVSYGALILIFPLNLYFNCLTRECGNLGAWIIFENEEITYSLTDGEGNAINPTVSDKEPEDPKNKDYWIDTSADSKGLYQYSTDLSMWVAVPTTYIMISVNDPQFGQVFKKGDAIFIDGTSVENIANGSIIKKCGYDETKGWIVVTGLIDTVIKETPASITFERKIPKLDYVCVSNNRVFGCYYGEENGQIVNEVYASKLGDATNWYTYAGLSTDSYALSLGDDGPFTGAITYNGYPLFFKENVIYKLYGNYPAAYQLVTYDCRGCQKGSGNSIALVGEYIFYKSTKSICVFNGEYPSAISAALGEEEYDRASAGASVNKYYISMRNKKTGKFEQFVYDTDTGLWIKEDELEITQYAYTKTGTLYGLSGNDILALVYEDEPLDEKEEYVEWEAVTGTFNYDYPDKIFMDRLTIRAKIPFGSEINVAISYDDRPFTELKTLRGDATVESQSMGIACKRCDHFRLKFSGHGDVRIYSIARTYFYGSEKNANDNR